MSKKISEIDVIELIKSKGGKDFLIDVSLDENNKILSSRILIRNGIILLLCRADAGKLKVDGKEYILSKNNIVILPENHIIENLNSISLHEQWVIAVSIDYILNMPSPIDTNIFSYSRYSSVIKIDDVKFEDLLTYYKFLYKENSEESKYQDEIISSIFYALILEIIGEYEKVMTSDVDTIKSDNLSDKFFKLLATNYRKNRSVNFYATQLNLTPKYLSTAIKKVTGRPILEWIHEAILIDAKMLLRTTNLTIQEISDELNFSSSSAFVQFIKKHTNQTPNKLRIGTE